MRSTFLTLHWVILLMVLDILYFLTVLYSKYFITSFSGCGQSISAHSPVLSLISPISLDSRLKRIFKCLSTQSHSYTNPSCPWSSHLDCSCSHQVDPGVCSLSLLLFRAWKRGLWAGPCGIPGYPGISRDIPGLDSNPDPGILENIIPGFLGIYHIKQNHDFKDFLVLKIG